MKIESRYFGHAIDIDVVESMSNGEMVTIAPHDQLVEVILNTNEAIENNIQAHTTAIITEPGHYAFLCTISDKNGRRVEEIGESTMETLETPIARNYPALMAFKRSFDAAAIRFLGLPGKVYSDQQVSVSDASTGATGVTYGAPPIEEPDSDTPSEVQKEPVDAADTQNGNNSAKTPSTSKTAEKPAKKTEKKAAYAAPPLEGMDDMLAPEVEPAATTKPSGYAAPPIEDEPVTDATDDSPAAAANDSDSASKPSSYAAPPLEEDIGNDASPSESSGPQDEFDTTIVQCGLLKKMGYSVRKAYEMNPGAVRWVAELMTPRNNLQKEQQAVCKRFLETVKEAE